MHNGQNGEKCFASIGTQIRAQVFSITRVIFYMAQKPNEHKIHKKQSAVFTSPNKYSHLVMKTITILFGIKVEKHDELRLSTR